MAQRVPLARYKSEYFGEIIHTVCLLSSFHSSLSSLQALQVALAEHQEEVDYLTSAVEQVFQKAPPDISQK